MKMRDGQTQGAVPAGWAPRCPSSITAAAGWLVPPLLCFVIYWPGLTAWFQADDFAWLALRPSVHDWHSLIDALFIPKAQGSIRPLSERAYFLVFESLFGLNALPFRICAFLTQCASLTLLAAVTRRLTGSHWAGFWAAMLWMVNSSLVTSMCWTSAYNQLLCGFFLLGAFWFLLRYIESGRPSHYIGQCILFLLGFGALEVNIVYPALAALYTFLMARKHFRGTLPLFIPSVIFAVVHRMAAPASTSTVYALYFDRALPTTFLIYWHWALVSANSPPGFFGRLDPLLFAVLTLLLLAFVTFRALRRDWLPAFCLAWFVIVLAPLLPLRNHRSDYYLTLPTIGLAILGAYALVGAWRRRPTWKLVGVAALTAYTILMVRVDLRTALWWNRRSLAVQRMILGVARAHQLHPGKTIVLDGVDGTLFWAGIFHHPFRLFGVYGVYLTPGSENYIEAHDSTGGVADYVLPAGAALHAAKTDEFVVYRAGSNRLKAITSAYEEDAIAHLTPEVPRRIDALNPLMAYLFGPEWYPPEEGAHWMPRRATFRIGGPIFPSQRLYLKGFLTPVQLAQPPVSLRVMMDGIPLPEAPIDLGRTDFEVSYPLPNEAVGKKDLLVGLEVGRTFRNGADIRELGMNFATFEVR